MVSRGSSQQNSSLVSPNVPHNHARLSCYHNSSRSVRSASSRLARSALANAQQQQEERNEQLSEAIQNSIHLDNNTADDSSQPIMNSFMTEAGYDAISIMTPFTFDEFELIWDQVGGSIEPSWYSG